MSKVSKEMYLSELVEMNKFDDLKDLVENKGVCVDSPDANGDTALHVAASKLKENAVRYLLLQGADPNARNALGSTPLHKLGASDLARKSELDDLSLKVALLLLECGGDPCLPNAAGITPYLLSPPNSAVRYIFSTKCTVREVTVEARYMGAVIGEGGKTVKRIKKEYGCSVDTPKDAVSSSKDAAAAAAPPVVITLTGSAANTERAAAEIEKLAGEIRAREERAEERRRAEERKRAEDDTATVINVPSEKVGFLIGAKGKNITAIRKEFGVEITIPEKDEARDHADWPKDTPAGMTPVFVRGKGDSVYDASDKIRTLLKDAPAHRPQYNNNNNNNSNRGGHRQRQIRPSFRVVSADAAYNNGAEEGGDRRGRRRGGDREETAAVEKKEEKEEKKEEKVKEVKVSMDEFPSIGEEEVPAAVVVKKDEKKEGEESGETAGKKKITIVRKSSK